MRYKFSKKVSDSFMRTIDRKKLQKVISTYKKCETECFCGSNTDVTIYEQDRYELPLTFCMCKNCGTIRLKHQIAENDLKNFYEKHYRDLYFNMRLPKIELIEDEQRPRGRKIINMLNRHQIRIKDATVLEIGAGAAGILDELKLAGAVTTALEADLEYAEYIRSRNQHHVIQNFLTEGSIKEISLEKYDIIILSHVLEHISDPETFIRLITKLMHADSVLYIEVPSTENVGDIANKLLDFFHIGHPWSFNHKSLLFLCNKSYLIPLYLDKHIHGIFKKSGTRLNIRFRPFIVNFARIVLLDAMGRVGLLGSKRRVLRSLARLLPLTVKRFIKGVMS